MRIQVVDGKRIYHLEGRVAVMVRWLALRAEKVKGPQKVQVVFDCAGSKVFAEVKEREAVDAALV